jgi:hypothetical protein
LFNQFLLMFWMANWTSLLPWWIFSWLVGLV